MRAVATLVVAALATIGSAAAAQPFAHHSRTSTVRVIEKEMHVLASPKVVPAGRVSFEIRNGGSVAHELVVLRHDRGGRLPVRHFKAEEAGVLGEAAEIAPGKRTRLTLRLKPGRYLLLCNVPGHYQLGMFTLLRVT